jgi:hypothetical protein
MCPSSANAASPRGTLALWLAQPWVYATWTVVAAFGAYASMYGFRKPFTAGTYADTEYGLAFKTWLVTAQVLGYTLSKFIGIRVISEMPFSAGLVFLLPVLGFVWMLRQIPPPSAEDVSARSERAPMSRAERMGLLRRHGFRLFGVLLAFMLITVLRSIRADFAPEIWAGLGLGQQPGIFARSEFWVAIGVAIANGTLVLVRDNRRAFFTSLGLCAAGLCLALGYLGYAGVMLGRSFFPDQQDFLGFFVTLALGLMTVALICVLWSWLLYSRTAPHGGANPPGKFAREPLTTPLPPPHVARG